MSKRILVSCLIVAVAVAIATPAVTFAQPDLPDIAPFVLAVPFDFAPPGARALGMGQAFIGVADDATAAEANPAGLVILTRPEVSLHYGNSSYTLPTVDTNAVLSIDVINQNGGCDGAGSSCPSPILAWDDEVGDISFASFVYPFKSWAISAYYQQQSSFEGNTLWSGMDGPFFDLFTAQQDIDFSQENAGISAAFRLGERVSIGVSARYGSLDVDAFNLWQVDYFSDFEFAGLPPSSFSDELVVSQAINDDDTDTTFNAGMLFNPNGKVSVGLTYKQGGSYEVSGTQRAYLCWNVPQIGASCDAATGTGNGYAPLTDLIAGFPLGDFEEITQTIDVPDAYGIGLGWRPSDRFLISADVVNVTWSDLDRRNLDFINAAPELEAIDDEIEYHLGLEYTLLAGNTPISLRAGGYSIPDRDGLAFIDTEGEAFTAGLGVVFGQRFQIDLGGAFGDDVDRAVLSGVFRF